MPDPPGMAAFELFNVTADSAEGAALGAPAEGEAESEALGAAGIATVKVAAAVPPRFSSRGRVNVSCLVDREARDLTLGSAVENESVPLELMR